MGKRKDSALLKVKSEDRLRFKAFKEWIVSLKCFQSLHSSKSIWRIHYSIILLEEKSSNNKEVLQISWRQRNLFLQMGMCMFGCTMSAWFTPWNISFHSILIVSNERTLDTIFFFCYIYLYCKYLSQLNPTAYSQWDEKSKMLPRHFTWTASVLLVLIRVALGTTKEKAWLSA